jgi:hypothetical protein
MTHGQGSRWLLPRNARLYPLSLLMPFAVRSHFNKRLASPDFGAHPDVYPS